MLKAYLHFSFSSGWMRTKYLPVKSEDTLKFWNNSFNGLRSDWRIFISNFSLKYLKISEVDHALLQRKLTTGELKQKRAARCIYGLCITFVFSDILQSFDWLERKSCSSPYFLVLILTLLNILILPLDIFFYLSKYFQPFLHKHSRNVFLRSSSCKYL